MKTISIVTPCFNEEENIEECYNIIKEIFDNKLTMYRREHIFCDNASTDRTVDILRKIAEIDPEIKIILNQRNVGPMRSNYNGVMAAGGDAVVLFMPADLQDPPELIPEMIDKWEQGAEIVYGIRATRSEGFILRSVRKLYYRLISRFSTINVPPDVGDYQLVDRRIVEGMRHIEDSYPFMRIMTFEVGGRSVGIPYHWRARKRGISKNNILTLLDQGLNGLVTFTVAPIRLTLYFGFLIAFCSVLYAALNLIYGLLFFGHIAQPGIMTLIVALFFFGGVQLFFLGLIGEYILAIYGQVRKKPMVIERDRINFIPSTLTPTTERPISRCSENP
ncbi:MAG: glycosyltransferase family 2 protein [Methylacidiphilales bacterium]|nr:glycosyltransferase family 2 protein [Candidatus Methylacidiphilales bacterium]